jgi:replication fork protection complex subunit Csm3/Swi3
MMPGSLIRSIQIIYSVQLIMFDRLLSAAGIPKLRRISKERLRFKGKGHEVFAELLCLRPHAHGSQYGDIARMLNMYQLWLDDLYPRAKFADGLAIIEKLGHSKRIQYMRKEWIAEGRPKVGESDPEDNDVVAAETTGDQDAERMEGVEEENMAQENESQTSKENDVPQQIPDTSKALEDDPDEDELDALLADNAAPGTSFASTALRPKPAAFEEDNFEDDEDAMAEMEGMW